MKTAHDYIIKTTIYEQMIDDVDAEMVSESLRCSIFKNIDKQIHEIDSKNTSTWARKHKITEILPDGFAIDKVTDDDWVEYTDPKDRKKAIRSIVIDNASSKDGIAVLVNNNGNVTHVVGPFYKASFSGDNLYIVNKFNKNDVIELFTDSNSKMYVLYLDGFKTTDIKNGRWKAKTGIVKQGDEYYNSELARKNVERYKRIIAKNKVEKEVKTDDTAKELQKLLNDVMELQVSIFNEPEKYYTVQRELEKAQGTIGGDRWQSSKGTTIMLLFATYTDYMRNILKSGGVSYERSGYESTKKKLKERIEVARNYYENAKKMFDEMK